MAKKNQEEVVESTEMDATQEAKAPAVEIIRGRMPVAVVALIRFKEEGATVSATAAKYRTTVGKVDDIRKNRNFGYVTAEFQPTEEQKTQAIAYLEQLAEDNVSDTLEKLESLGLAEDGGAAFEEARKNARKNSKPAETATDNADAPVDEVTESEMDEFTE